MIRGYGKRGNLDDALQMTKRMEANGFTPSADSMCGLIDAHLIIKVRRAYDYKGHDYKGALL